MARPLRPRALTAILAVTCAVTSSTIYLVQPMLDRIADDLHVGTAAVAGVSTATQVGYALGVLVLVPLGDVRDRRPLILVLLAGGVVAVLAAAVAPGVVTLTAAMGLVGFLAPVPQIAIPLGVALAGDVSRARVVGILQGGLLVGLLASRAYAGALAEASGWRSVLVVSALAEIVVGVVLLRRLPSARGTSPEPYTAVLRSLPRLLVAPRFVLGVCVSGALVGVAFGAFWNTLTFELGRSFGLGPAAVGLFGLVAAASAVTSPLVGRLADRIGRPAAQAVAIVVAVLGWVALGIGHHGGLGWMIAGTVLIDVGVWGNQVVNQAALFTRPDAVHSRLNTLYFVTRFLGIAAGSMLGAAVWTTAGWVALAIVGVAVLVVAAVPASCSVAAAPALAVARPVFHTSTVPWERRAGGGSA